jgi:hypothetical protein
MLKITRAAVVCAALTAMLATGVAQAAAPGIGTLSKAKRSVTWNGGPYVVSYPTSNVECVNGSSDSMCDHFMLKVNMGQGAKIKVAIVPSSSGLEILQILAGPNDYDLYVYGPDGNKVGESAGSTGRESVTFKHKASFRNKAYEVRVVPFLMIPGATYKGTATALSYVK